MSNIKVKVERAAYERNDKSYFAYFIRGNIRGRDIRVLIVPTNEELMIERDTKRIVKGE